VRCDAPVAADGHPDHHRDELFDLPLEGAGRHGGTAHLAESTVDIRDHLAQGMSLRIEVIQYVVEMVVFTHIRSHRTLWATDFALWWRY
jgi:hypothetical protein